MSRRPFAPSPITLSRRTVLEWMGQGVSLSLLVPGLAACASKAPCCGEDSTVHPEGSAGGDTGCPDADFAFEPGAGDAGVYDGWRVRTVDAQDLEAILAGWRLTVDGMVEKPLVLSFADLLALARQDQVTDFHCVEGWSVYDVPWNGVHIGTLLAAAGAKTGATHITFHTIGGEYNESLPLDVALEATTMLAYGVCDASLTLDHGFPLRLVVPRLLGYKNAKYLTRLELTDHAVEGYWVKAGYPYEGEVPEDRLREGKY